MEKSERHRLWTIVSVRLPRHRVRVVPRDVIRKSCKWVGSRRTHSLGKRAALALRHQTETSAHNKRRVPSCLSVAFIVRSALYPVGTPWSRLDVLLSQGNYPKVKLDYLMVGGGRGP